MNELFSLKEKTILLTGGYGYLGRSIAIGLAEAQGDVFVLGKDEKRFQEAFERRSNIYFQHCDVSDTASIASAFKSVSQRSGINVLINNAFYLKGQDPETMTDEDWEYGIDGTLNNVFRCIREVIPYLKKTGGKIVNVSSMYGVVSPDFEVYKDHPEYLNPPHYGAAKAGVIQLTKYYAGYLSKYGINVNCIAPGAFPSEDVQKNLDFINRLSDHTMLRRIGEPEKLMGAFIFFSSAASDYITGETLQVDGGWTAQ